MKTFATLFTLSNLILLAASNGTQFITGPCTSDSDCADGCCGFNTGLCAGAVVAQQRDGGCGHGNATPNNNAALALGSTAAASGVPAAGGVASTGAASAAATSAAAAASPSSSSSSSDSAKGEQNLGNGQGKQFITGVCDDDADCASGCCGFNTGLCAGAVIAQTRDGGCGFGNTTPNNNAALALGSTVAASGVSAAAGAGATSSAAAAAAPVATSSSASTSGSASADSAGDENVGNGQGKQFITGKCDSDADCQSTCCASGLCSAVAVAAAKGGCGFVARKRMFWA